MTSNLQRSLITACLSVFATVMIQAQGDSPPNPEFGKCYAKYTFPNQYETVTEQVMIKPEYKKITIVPASHWYEYQNLEIFRSLLNLTS